MHTRKSICINIICTFMPFHVYIKIPVATSFYFACVYICMCELLWHQPCDTNCCCCMMTHLGPNPLLPYPPFHLPSTSQPNLFWRLFPAHQPSHSQSIFNNSVSVPSQHASVCCYNKQKHNCFPKQLRWTDRHTHTSIWTCSIPNVHVDKYIFLCKYIIIYAS